MVGKKNLPHEAGTAEPCLLPAHLRKVRLRRSEVSEYLRLVFGIEYAPATLAKLASVGGGPPFNRLNNTPLYPVSELRAWAEAKLGRLQSSTSDTGEG